MTKELLEIEIKRYFTISIKKLFTTNKEKIGFIEIEQNKIRNNINNLKSDSLQYVEEVEILNNKFLELELQKPQIDWSSLSFKCTQQMKDRYKEFDVNMIIKLIEKTKNIFIKNNYSLQSFRNYNNISRRKSYQRKKEKLEIITMTGTEKALKTAQIKREKSFKIFNECIEILSSKNEKISSSNIYKIIKNDFNNCMSLRQVQRYFKELKSSNGN